MKKQLNAKISAEIEEEFRKAIHQNHTQLRNGSLGRAIEEAHQLYIDETKRKSNPKSKESHDHG